MPVRANSRYSVSALAATICVLTLILNTFLFYDELIAALGRSSRNEDDDVGNLDSQYVVIVRNGRKELVRKDKLPENHKYAIKKNKEDNLMFEMEKEEGDEEDEEFGPDDPDQRLKHLGVNDDDPDKYDEDDDEGAGGGNDVELKVGFIY